MDLKSLNVLVFGSGISGIGAAQLLRNEGANVTIYDGNKDRNIEDVLKPLDSHDINIILGDLDQGTIESLDLVVLSPGVPLDNQLVIKMKEKQIPIWGEIELAFLKESGTVLALTGTNGKTTTTALLGQIMNQHQEEVFVVGNIGIPYTQQVDKTSHNSVSVAELSSFQLETIHDFKPKVSAILNLTPDHLNRHYTMEAYVAAKLNIAKNQTEADVCILNYEDDSLREFGEKLSTQVLYFSSQRKIDKGMYLSGDNIIINVDKAEVLCSIHDLKLLGVHNYENVMAASLMALSYGVSIDTIRKVVCEYQGVEHRIEFVCEKNGVTYYNDSKGTNPDAAIKGIKAMVRPTVLIGGGYDKESDFTEWIRSFEGKVTHLLLTGETKEKIANTAKENGFHKVIVLNSFEEAVHTSIELAREGDAVLLSPACASWGQFSNYEERGDKFKEIVKNK